MTLLRDIRRQIQSIRKIGHITRAMKIVSAIRLMRVQAQVLRQKPYARKLREMVADLVVRTPLQSHPMLQASAQVHKRESAQAGSQPCALVTCLVLGSDRGLCGAYNNSLVDALARFQPEHAQDQIETIVFGKRLRDLLRTKRVPATREYLGFYHDLTFEKVVDLAGEFRDRYLARQLDELWFIYTEFKSTARQGVVAEQLLPIGAGTLQPEPLFPEYRYEPDAYSVLDRLLPMYYERELWRVFLESVASEHMARMRAMDLATVNAAQMIRDLTLTLNKARQEAITRELAEISTAAEALRGE